jgi:hypothetical protein
MRAISFILFVFLLLLPAEAVASISVQSPLANDFRVSAGDVVRGAIVLRNETDQPQQVRFYQTDYLFAADGTNSFSDPGSHARSNALWIELAQVMVNLAPFEVLPVAYTVKVPPGGAAGAQAGTYWSIVMVESVDLSLGPDPASRQIGFRQVTRYGVQISTTFAQSGEQNIDFPRAQLLREASSQLLEVDLFNGGDYLATTDTWVEVYDAAGRRIDRRKGSAYRLFPGTSVRQRIELGELAPGTYEVLVLVEAGADEVFAAQYTVTI